MPRDARVLVVDDDDDSRYLLADALRRAGYAVTEAADGRDAITTCRREPPWLVITDCAMPGLTGPELVRRLALDRRLRRIPIIVVSSAPPPRLPDANVISVVTKPVDPRRLLAVVRICAVSAHPARSSRRAG
jgi:CheY-like chemotaxis protein